MKSATALSQTEVILAGLIGIVVVLQVASLACPSDFRLVIVLLLVAGLVNWRLENVRSGRLSKACADWPVGAFSG